MHRVTVVGRVCANSNESAKKTYGSSQHCNRLIYNVEFFIEQPLRKATEFKWNRIGAPVDHFACPRRCLSIYHPFT